jgi:hypothetical protein
VTPPPPTPAPTPRPTRPRPGWPSWPRWPWKGPPGFIPWPPFGHKPPPLTPPSGAEPAPPPGHVQDAPPGAKGFDTDTPLTAKAAAAFVKAGFRFAIRYLSLEAGSGAGDLTDAEARVILGTGLALMAVQHVEASGWRSIGELGQRRGQAAAENARAAGLPAGVSLWLDLEGVALNAASAEIIAYCNAWFGAVGEAGYAPGLYVGAGAGLTGAQIEGLSCRRFWQSGSVVPALPNRGYCMTQSISSHYVLGGVAYDLCVVHDAPGGEPPVWLAPELARPGVSP